MKNKNFQVTFMIYEDIYFQFKEICIREKREPAAVIKELIIKYVSEKENQITG